MLQTAVPADNMAWCMYGSKSEKYGDHSEEYAGYQRTYKQFFQAPATPNLSIRRDNPLTVKQIHSIFEIAPFTAYQTPGDFSHVTSCNLVSVSFSDLGTGAHLGEEPIDWERLHQAPYHRSTFQYIGSTIGTSGMRSSSELPQHVSCLFRSVRQRHQAKKRFAEPPSSFCQQGCRQACCSICIVVTIHH